MQTSEKGLLAAREAGGYRAVHVQGLQGCSDDRCGSYRGGRRLGEALPAQPTYSLLSPLITLDVIKKYRYQLTCPM
jgi:hypothetical protein